MEHLLSLLGNPHLAAKTVHITGTKGKGSVAAMIASVLTTSGYRTGLYTSPHLLNLRERIKVGGNSISETEFAASMTEIMPAIESMKQSGRYRELTYFEVLTALTFVYFRIKQVDFQVLEVGLGGRLDATNVVPQPLVCIITSVSRDHIQILGDTLEQIAREKAGIVKPGCWVVVSPQHEQVASVINEICAQKEAKLVRVSKDVSWHKIGGDLQHQSLVIQGRNGRYEVDIPLLGDFQLENAATAVAALEILSSLGFHISATDITRGLAKVQWPGRFHILRYHPIVVIDGAHNKESARRLVSNLKDYFPSQRVILVFGTSRDKDIPGMVEELASLHAEVIVTKAQHPRAANIPDLIAEFGKRGVQPQSKETTAQAFSTALTRAERNDVICVTGSLFLVAEALDYFSKT